MVEASGFVPTILYNEIEMKDNLVAKGSDIELKIRSAGRTTSVEAVTLGGGKWEIEELDDAANLFPEYSPGDVISLDVLKKVLNQGNPLAQSREILSFNLLGKIKYGLKDIGDAVDEKVGGVKKGLKKVGDWFTDAMDKETAQNYLRQYYPGANVGEVAMTLNQDGKYWKVLFGVPSEEKFYVLTLYRNGNDIRTLDDDDYPDTPILSYTDGNEAQKAFDKYPFIPGTEGEEGEGNVEFTEEDVQSAIPEGYDILDFEEIEDENQKYEGLPTAVAICSMQQDDGNGLLNVLKVYKKDGKVWGHPSDNASFLATKQNAGTVVQQAIEKYKEFGGKKDLSYLLQGNSQQAEEEAPTKGTTEDGIEWEIAAALRRKKSKWNGKNVTGYEEGSMFEMADAPAMAASSRRTFSKLFASRGQGI